MAKYRPIYTNIWKDPNFQNFNSTEKIIFIYLFSNEQTSESGIYPITTQTIANETGLTKSSIDKVLVKGLPNVCYDFERSFVFVVNFLTHNGKGRPDLVKKAIENENEKFATPLWAIFNYRYPYFKQEIDYKQLNKDLEKTLQDLDKSFPKLNSNSNRNSNSISININTCKRSNKRIGDNGTEKKKRETKKYAEYVFLTEEEYQRFIKEYGEANTKKFIEKLDNYKGANGKKYDDDNRAIRNWVIKEILGEKQQSKFDAVKELAKKEKEAQGG